MIITEYTKDGETERTLTLEELKAYSRRGNRQALKELIDLKGGWSALTAIQKEKVTQILVGYEVDL